MSEQHPSVCPSKLAILAREATKQETKDDRSLGQKFFDEVFGGATAPFDEGTLPDHELGYRNDMKMDGYDEMVGAEVFVVSSRMLTPA